MNDTDRLTLKILLWLITFIFGVILGGLHVYSDLELHKLNFTKNHCENLEK